MFDAMYAEDGRPSIPPERLLKASLLIALYSVWSERAFCEELGYHLLFRWFLDLDPIEPSFDPTAFTKNRERLLKHKVGQELFDEVVGRAHERGLLSDEHFTVDGTLIEAAASLKSFKRKDGQPPRVTDDDPSNPSVDVHGEKRSNKTHQSTTDPDARLMRKGFTDRRRHGIPRYGNRSIRWNRADGSKAASCCQLLIWWGATVPTVSPTVAAPERPWRRRFDTRRGTG